ncbi:MAG: tRNA uridine-5-carboxymethylaminomethyl(34) synthesis GTPase MnmE, partial [Xanthomonadales bacterium]|nr:tRNA uridine-5-carboxymethylaminomethyl(34) synthesis GTPase MnmE [Xanthomonadales bacterium]
MSPQPARDTIAAIASPAGHGGVGVIRVSGPAAATMASILLGREPTPRLAHYCRWQDETGAPIDQGLLLYFPAPRSYTGEDVLELQGHGGRVVLELLLQRVLALGARLARPGEFTERAFLEGKLDLAQAEAVADLITAGSASAARAALRSLDGVFSDRVDALLSELVALRVLLEAAIDFPDEEIDILSEGDVSRRLALLLQSVQQLLQEAERGQRLRDGLYLVILGPPNAGKSSLLNALAGSDRAIVTPIAGTTRDVLREALVLRGVPVTVVDTAGLRDSDDPIEAEGVRRARLEAARADHALIVLDDSDPEAD